MTARFFASRVVLTGFLLAALALASAAARADTPNGVRIIVDAPFSPNPVATNQTSNATVHVEIDDPEQGWEAPPEDASITWSIDSPATGATVDEDEDDSSIGRVSASFASAGTYDVVVKCTVEKDGWTQPMVATLNPALPLVVKAPYEYDAGNAIVAGTAIPWEHTDIGVSPGETVIFYVSATDEDKRRLGAGAWANITGPGPYEMVFACSNDGEFDSSGSGTTSKTVAGLTSGNVTLIAKSTWSAPATITVTCTIKDLAPNPVAAPESGTTRDTNLVITWTLKVRANTPTSIATVSGPNATWRAAPATYTYKAGPDIGGDNVADYVNQTVLESFGTCSANGFFTMSDLTTAWKNANPTITTADQAAAAIFDSGNNGTFVLDANDMMADMHSGFGSTTPFTATALTNGVGYRLPQTYSAGSNTLGSYTIDRKYVSAAVTINKNGP